MATSTSRSKPHSSVPTTNMGSVAKFVPIAVFPYAALLISHRTESSVAPKTTGFEHKPRDTDLEILALCLGIYLANLVVAAIIHQFRCLKFMFYFCGTISISLVIAGIFIWVKEPITSAAYWGPRITVLGPLICCVFLCIHTFCKLGYNHLGQRVKWSATTALLMMTVMIVGIQLMEDSNLIRAMAFLAANFLVVALSLSFFPAHPDDNRGAGL